MKKIFVQNNYYNPIILEKSNNEKYFYLKERTDGKIELRPTEYLQKNVTPKNDRILSTNFDYFKQGNSNEASIMYKIIEATIINWDEGSNTGKIVSRGKYYKLFIRKLAK